MHLRRRLRLHDPSGAHLAAGRSEEEASGPHGVLHQEEARPVAARLHRRADPEDRLFRLEDLGTALRRHPRAERSRRRRGRPRLLRDAAWSRARPRPHRGPLHRLRPRRLRGPRWPMRRSATSSAIRSRISRRSASSSRTWPRRSKPRASFFTRVCNAIDSGERADLESSMVKYIASEMAGARHLRGAADPRRRRLHQAACGRALLARRPPDQDLRRHLGDSAPHHLRPAPQEGATTGTDTGSSHGSHARQQLLRGLQGRHGDAPCAAARPWSRPSTCSSPT